MNDCRQPLTPGYQLENFKIEFPLGQNCFSTTYAALDLAQNKQVVIKELFPLALVTRTSNFDLDILSELNEDSWEKAKHFFLEESNLLATTSLAFVPEIQCLLQSNKTLYQVRNYALGETYGAKIRRIGSEPDENSFMSILLPLFSRINILHKNNILHLNLNPENIILSPSGDIKLIGYGQALTAYKALMRITDECLNCYSSIEVIQNRDNIGPWSDIYSFAALMYFGFTGLNPPPANQRETGDDLFTDALQASNYLNKTMLSDFNKALEIEPNMRFSDMQDITSLSNKTHDASIDRTVRDEREFVENIPRSDKSSIIYPKLSDLSAGLPKRTRRLKDSKIVYAAIILLLTITIAIYYFVCTIVYSPSREYARGVKLLESASNSNQQVKAYKLICDAATRGNSAAQIKMYEVFLEGLGVEKNAPTAIKWLTTAANNADTVAQSKLAMFYATGTNVQKNQLEALKWYSGLAKQSDPIALNYLGNAYAYGLGVSKNKTEALNYWKKASELGYAEAQNSLGSAFYSGDGVKKDFKSAIEWFRKAAEQENSNAQYSLGNAFVNGNGVEKNFTEAITWFKRAAKLGNASAQRSLGDAYWKGEGVATNPGEAVKWYRLSAENSDSAAQFALGNAYFDGVGVEKNLLESLKWTTWSAENGCLDAQETLGLRYYHGNGVSKSLTEATKWLGKSALEGDPVSQYYLALIYNSTEDDLQVEQGLYWLQKSAAQGYPNAVDVINKLKTSN